MTKQEAIKWIREHHATDLAGYEAGYNRGAMEARGVFK